MSNENRTVLYLNIIIHDASEIIKRKVKKKVTKSQAIPKPLKEAVAKHVSETAAHTIKPARIAEKIGKKMCKKMPQEMKEKGLTVEMEEAFREGPYVVLQMQVVHVDTLAITNLQQKQETSYDSSTDCNSIISEETGSLATTLVQWAWSLIGSTNQEKLENGILPNAIQKNMVTKLSEILSKRFEAKRMVTHVEVLREEQQARYFYSTYKKVKAKLKEERKLSGIIKLLPPSPGTSSNRRSGRYSSSDSSSSDSDSEDDF